ncbi:MAG TPA: symmetrical bis(5'-nucleosyl)-tetraphosphatase [Casimicrobiaceae bacterium]|nr:symmetrical bis(5'-nucleosyl)-tetraphosphatase [Casimicrobiaceae bacterium]
MAHYAVGDVQGCHAELCELLELIAFSPRDDKLWLVGDLVNRGPASLAVLREVMALGDAATTVLGNHDFHLLTIAYGLRKPHRGDTVDDILAAPDRDAVIEWLARRPLVVADDDRLMVHAGLLPSWTPATALALSREVEAVMAGADRRAFLEALYGDEPRRWRDDLTGVDRLRAIVNVCTRLRYCTADDTMEFREKRGPAHTPDGFRAWFAQPARKSAEAMVMCGHWSALDLMLAPNVAMLDSGCVWGGPLTAIRLPDRRVYQVPSRQAALPKPSE